MTDLAGEISKKSKRVVDHRLITSVDPLNCVVAAIAKKIGNGVETVPDFRFRFTATVIG